MRSTSQRYLVECYVANERRDELSGAETRARAAARAMARDGIAIRYIRSTFIPEDDTCFHVFEGPSAAAVDEATRRADISYDRIVEAID